MRLPSLWGEDWNQKKISQLEGKETIDDALMEEIARALKVPVEAIRNFDEKTGRYHYLKHPARPGGFGKTITPYSALTPIDKIVELYESLLKSEKEKVEMLQKMMDERK